jgi:hypothetical protein
MRRRSSHRRFAGCGRPSPAAVVPGRSGRDRRYLSGGARVLRPIRQLFARFTLLFCVVMVGAASAGCVPVGSTAPLPPLAARLSGDRVELLYTSCSPDKVSQVKVVRPRGPVIMDDDPVVWEVTFDPPVARTSFVIGEVPQGGVEQVALTEPLDAATSYSYFLTSGTVEHNSFEPKRLANGDVNFLNRYMSAEEFARLSACTTNPAPKGT